MSRALVQCAESRDLQDKCTAAANSRYPAYRTNANKSKNTQYGVHTHAQHSSTSSKPGFSAMIIAPGLTNHRQPTPSPRRRSSHPLVSLFLLFSFSSSSLRSFSLPVCIELHSCICHCIFSVSPPSLTPLCGWPPNWPSSAPRVASPSARIRIRFQPRPLRRCMY